MFKTERERLILKQGGIAIGVMIAVYFLIITPFFRESGSILDEELDRKTAEIKRYIKRMGSLPSKEGFTRLKKEKERMENTLGELIEFIDPEKVRIAEKGSESGLYFIEKLHTTAKEFQKTVEKKGINIPEGLGFGDGLPKNELVDTLLRQLETVELVVGTLLESDEVDFSSIKPLKEIDYLDPMTKRPFYSELPVQFSVKTTTRDFINLLVVLKNSSPAISVKEIHIKSAGGETRTIEASFILSSYKIYKDGGGEKIGG